jgi:hypothetical protein
MTEIIQKYIVPIGVILTFIASILTIYFTRKNLKTSKFIDTITSERIKWIEKVRLEISEIYAELQEYLKLKYLLFSNEVKVNESQDIENILSQIDKLKDNSAISRDLERISKADLIKKLQLLKLRLNPIEDTEMISILDSYISLLLIGGSVEKFEEGWNMLSRLVELTQKMLKNEWEKVKKETKK